MISERQVAQGFDAMWAEVVPLLTPRFVQLFNEAYHQQLCSANGKALKAVDVISANNSSLVAELAFHFVRLATQRSLPLDKYSEANPELLADAERAAVRAIESYTRGKSSNVLVVGESEWHEASSLIANYRAFFATFSDDVINFGPRIKGAGYVDSCLADIAIGNVLIEVKTVNRNISGRDIRQLLVYFALESATATPRWISGEFFNPRRACGYKFAIEEIVKTVSGGRPAKDVFEDIVDYFANREIIVDSIF